MGGDDLTLSPSEELRISGAMNEASESTEWDISAGHKFFLCDEFVETEFRKAGRGGIMGHRYLNLQEYLPSPRQMTLADVADGLSGKTWK